MPRPKPGTPEAKPTIVPRTRKPSGDPIREIDRAKSPTLVRRILDHGVALGMDARLATQLGQLLLHGEITESECQAGFSYAEDCGRYAKIKGIPKRTARSPSWEGGFSGDKGVDLDALKRMDPEVADKIEVKIKRQNRSIENAYGRAIALVPSSPRYIRDHLDALCCEDIRIPPVYLADVRKILANLARHCYRVQDQEPETTKRAPAKTTKADAVHMAEAATEALIRWFEGEKAVITGFWLDISGRKSHRITAYGNLIENTETKERHAIEIPLRGIMGAFLAAQLLKAATAKGWNEIAPLPDANAAAADAASADAHTKPTINLSGAA